MVVARPTCLPRPIRPQSLVFVRLLVEGAHGKSQVQDGLDGSGRPRRAVTGGPDARVRRNARPARDITDLDRATCEAKSKRGAEAIPEGVVTGGREESATVNMNTPAHYLHWHWILISVPNLVVIVLMAAVFALAIALPFPGERS